jgi:hypothetical protein
VMAPSGYPPHDRPQRAIRPRGYGAPRARSTPLLPGQALLRRALLPIRPGKRTDDAAAGAHHARAEGGHRNVIPKAVHIDTRRWQRSQTTHSERTLCARMLASVIGGPR